MSGKLNIVTRLQHWMDSVPGQTFLNYAYSWGAAVVILGALFKLTHLKGGNLMLFIGMGTEAVVFFLAAFDRPFDKKEIGKELPKDFETDEEIERAEGWAPAIETVSPIEKREETKNSTKPTVEHPAASTVSNTVTAGSTEIVAQAVDAMAMAAATMAQTASTNVETQGTTFSSEAHETSYHDLSKASTEPSTDPVVPLIAAHYENSEGRQTVEQGAQRLSEIIRLANDELLRRTQAVLSPEMEAATEEYIQKLRTLNETLTKVDEQSARLTRDSQEMENLNRTLVGINKIYDLHFASISRQVTTIEDINVQTQQLAAKIEEVNRIYSRMMQTLNIMGNPTAISVGDSLQNPNRRDEENGRSDLSQTQRPTPSSES